MVVTQEAKLKARLRYQVSGSSLEQSVATLAADEFPPTPKVTEPTPCWENGATNERVFVQGETTGDAPDPTLEDLIGREHLFSPKTHLCIHCGISAEDDLLENQPCKP